MDKPSLFLLLLILSLQVSAQTGHDTLWKQLYRESDPRVNDLVHTKLEVKFDYDKAWLYGKAWLKLKPHFYPRDSLLLDAKQMEINKVSMSKGSSTLPLKYDYDGWKLKIKLDRVYKASEDYTIYIEYTAKPNEAKIPVGGYKGLYFINPTGKEKNKPVQVWTDGQTEYTSFWCPTIDKPNQKSTNEIIMIVPDKFVTLSNGKLINQKKNNDGTRTDHWKMDQPHAPYLFFMAVGDFAIVRDHYNGKEVNYYVEKEYASTAKKIFGLTPAMMSFYSKITGIPYPWVKYSQIVLRDFSSRAMENTTATAHGELAQQDARELIDGNLWETAIAHELFHQWFGDYVTCESWGNLTLNESFASYGEYLWKQYQYGSDAAGEENYTQLRKYLSTEEDQEKALVRFYYFDQEDMFDEVSYAKGSLVLNMLRNYVGDSAFFKGLNLYLTTNKFKSAEAHQFRLAMEEVTGKDLNWFFNQWYFGSGHPKVTINYRYNDSIKNVMVSITQTQDDSHVFKIPLTIDVYNGSSKLSHQVWLNNQKDTFLLSYASRPDLVNVDAGKFIVWEKTDNKTLENFIYQYTYASNYVDRREAIAVCLKHQENPLAISLLLKSLTDKSAELRQFTLSGLNMKNDSIKRVVEPFLLELAKNDKNSFVRQSVIQLLGTYRKKEHEGLLIALLNDSSYTVSGEALLVLAEIDSSAALREAKRLMNFKAKGRLAQGIVVSLIKSGSEDDFDLISSKFAELEFRMRIARMYVNYLAKVQSTEKFKKGVDIIVTIRESLSSFLWPAINQEILGDLLLKKQAARLQEQADYIKSKLPKQQ